MNDHDTLLAIQQLMDGTAWNSDTLEQIASVMVSAGYRIRDLDDRDREGFESRYDENDNPRW